jgi:hypothetical protein
MKASVALCFICVSLLSGAVRVEKVAYHGWPNCYRLSNGTVELVVTSDVGPRIIRYGFPGGENEFMEEAAQLGTTGGDEWRAYGGHRLWHAPEAQPRTYWPDNVAVKVEPLPNGVRLIQPVEGTTGMQKEIEVRLAETGSQVHVLHRLRNAGMWPVELAPWALTVMAPGGVAIFPLPPRGPHPKNLLPTSAMAVWAYTDFTDPRWFLGQRYIVLRQDPKARSPQKIGLSVPDGWAAYLRQSHLFVKKFTHDSRARYPDFGVSVETFTNAAMLEVETLGPLSTIQPGAAVEHLEHWFLYADIRLDPLNDDTIDRVILPRIKESLPRP